MLFSNNDIVDVADYTVWHDGLGETFDAEDYDAWRRNFGAAATAGSGATAASAAVPEPSSLLLAIAAVLTLSMCRKHRG